jgi:hypothetical protein
VRHARWMLTALPALALMACAKKPDTAAVPYFEQHIEEVPQWIADLDAELADTGRAQRWREDQRRWSAMKKEYVDGLMAKRSKEIAASLANNSDIIRRLQSLRSRGAIGAEGAVPTMLEITPISDSTVELRNVSSQPLHINAWRTMGGANGKLVTRCELQARDAAHNNVFDPQIAPGESVRFGAYWPVCNHVKKGSPLEFEIRRGEELVWVSGSRLPALLQVPGDAVEEVLANRGAR